MHYYSSRCFAVETGEVCRAISSHSTGHRSALYWAASTVLRPPHHSYAEKRVGPRRNILHIRMKHPEDNRIRFFFQARSQKGSRSHEFCKPDRNTNPWKERSTEIKKIQKKTSIPGRRENCVRVCTFVGKRISAIARTIPR
mgnify:CR=1 FL=1